ncbi:antirestriction protein [Leucobacter luti]|uniref:Antirestriction protein n=1 Tax=Leucobacter luti TaxID=340320 RepID=A0A4R6RSH6_9MICO|nr:antirestriction protein ArdA [Leucobacter luti]TDP89770.1 antirestriction protein [Leucobacter luti]
MTADSVDWTPRVWVGCLACYNAGHLVGEWCDAVDAGEVTSSDIHGTHTRADLHDELWCFDTENIPMRGEMSPSDAAQWGEILSGVEDHLRAALNAWVESGSYTAEGTGDLPSVSEFRDQHLGHWDSFRDYVESLAEDTGLLDGMPETLQAYFDWDRFANDERHSYSVCDATEGGVHIFTA